MKNRLRGIRIFGLLILCMMLYCVPGMAVEDTALKGKSILFFGDSLTAGYGLEDQKDSWCSQLETVFGMKVTNASISGSTVCAGLTWYEDEWHQGVDPMSRREIPGGKFDIILVESGGNDWYNNLPLGSVWDQSDMTFCGGLRTTLQRLKKAHPEAAIVFMSAWEDNCGPNWFRHNLGDYTNAAIRICDEMGVKWFPAFDAFISGIHTNDPTFRELFCLDETDRWHLNPAGHRLFLPVIASWLRWEIYDEDPTEDVPSLWMLPPGLVGLIRNWDQNTDTII